MMSLYPILRIIEGFFRKNQRTEREKYDYIDQCDTIAYPPCQKFDRSSCRDIVFEIECLEIREKYEDSLCDIPHSNTMIPYRIVKHGISTMSDDIARDREEHRNHRRGECRKKQDQSKKRKKLQYYPDNCRKKKWIEGESFRQKECYENHTLKYNHSEYDSCESEKLPKKYRRPRYRLR